jgi:hypothetical protein
MEKPLTLNQNVKGQLECVTEIQAQEKRYFNNILNLGAQIFC